MRLFTQTFRALHRPGTRQNNIRTRVTARCKSR
jgi:hypothetical protein